MEELTKVLMSGSLDLHIVHDPNGQYDAAKGDRYLGIAFEPTEWEAVFFKVLHCPEAEPFIQGEDLDEYYERYRRRFQQAIADYPMLGRIWDMYEDVCYMPEEMNLLQNECRRVQTRTSNAYALEGLRKLRFACNEALKLGMGLYMASD
jgi:hypothetical protein